MCIYCIICVYNFFFFELPRISVFYDQVARCEQNVFARDIAGRSRIFTTSDQYINTPKRHYNNIISWYLSLLLLQYIIMYWHTCIDFQCGREKSSHHVEFTAIQVNILRMQKDETNKKNLEKMQSATTRCCN